MGVVGTKSWVGIALCLVACSDEGSVVVLPGAPPLAIASTGPSGTTASTSSEISPRLLRRFAPIDVPATNQAEQGQIDLGRVLYFEPLLSKSGTISCNSCHPLDRYGATNTRVSTGVDGQRGTRNAPSTYNAVGHFRQDWDGRAATLAQQAIGPIEDPSEMGMRAAEVVRALERIPGYRPLFEHAFPGTNRGHLITIDRVAQALAAFERGLITPGRWDRYLRGDLTALSSREKEGARTFANLGCVVCHTGAMVGGTMFERLGVHVPWPNQRDRGRKQVTKNDTDDMVFKVPSLRNVARTAPYFHDGSAATLEEAVRAMARHQLGVELTGDEVNDLTAWLEALTGEIPLDYVAPPPLPPAVRP